jgi:UDP-N-acetyl-D-glucosamine dehydrogenase
MNLKKKIREKKAKVAVIGLGYIGLLTAIHIAKVGFEVFGIDIKEERIKKVNSGNSYIGDVSSNELKEVIKSGKLKAFANYLPLKNSEIVLICVPTPLDKVKNPDLTYVKETTKEIAKYLHKEQLIILESTCPPETTRKVILPELEKTGLKVGKDFYLAHCPERVDPGNKKWNLKNIPRIVGGITKNCTRLAKIFYQSFLGVEIFEVSSPEVAEMTKILENAFRLINISFINELALLARRMGIDIWEVIEAAKTKPFGFMPFYPSPKCGGHCIPIVPFFLASKAKEYNFWTRFIELAGQINEQMPHFVMTKVIWVLNLKRKSIRGSKVLVWGVAYKKDVGDTRESAAYDVIADLIRKGAEVDYFDPYVKEFEITHRILKKPVKLKSIEYSLQKIKKYDLVLILTDHSGFDYEKLAKEAKLIVDTRNTIKSRKHKNVFYL